MMAAGEQHSSEALTRLCAVNRAVMGLFGPIRALEDQRATALLNEADDALTRLWLLLEARVKHDARDHQQAHS